jgi:alpha-beta hydrolase superfamily lysophospholipase
VDFTSDSVHRGVRERAATIVGSHGTVPLALWTPEGAAPKGLVLVGHGGSGHKREDYVLALARRLVRAGDFAVASIDGPVHGDRRAANAEVPTLVLMEFAQAWSSDTSLTDGMVNDWVVTLDELQEDPDLANAPVGYWGLSMGTLLGLPFVASQERVIACVLGLAGLVGPTSQRLAEDAPKILVPTLFLVQLDDELFATEASLELFRALGTPDKRLYAAPGKHRDVPADAFHLSIQFLIEQLADHDVVAEQAS